MAGTTEYKNKWQKENLDRISLTVPKGDKALLQTHADEHGESLNHFINRAITEAMERDRLVDARKDELIAYASSRNKSIGDDELKELVIAFAALKPVIPNIESIYFPEPQQDEVQHEVHRECKISVVSLNSNNSNNKTR